MARKKDIFAIERFDTILHGDEYNFTEEDKQEMLRRFLNKQSVRCLLPKFISDARNIERKLALFESLKVTYMQLKAHK